MARPLTMAAAAIAAVGVTGTSVGDVTEAVAVRTVTGVEVVKGVAVLTGVSARGSCGVGVGLVAQDGINVLARARIIVSARQRSELLISLVSSSAIRRALVPRLSGAV